MKGYRVRHIPTGLFYRPGANNLSEVGKWYPNKNTIKSYIGNFTATLTLSYHSNVYKKYRELFESIPHNRCWVSDGVWKIEAFPWDFELVETDLSLL